MSHNTVVSSKKALKRLFSPAGWWKEYFQDEPSSMMRESMKKNSPNQLRLDWDSWETGGSFYSISTFFLKSGKKTFYNNFWVNPFKMIYACSVLKKGILKLNTNSIYINIRRKNLFIIHIFIHDSYIHIIYM